MLLSLYVQNFAIIDNIEIEFKDKMTVLTGETGAGKSLIIDAIGLLFGNRASSNLVRFGESKAVIEGVFSEMPSAVKNLFDFSNDDVLIIRREIYSNGKSICKLNNQNITLSQLVEISEYIGDIHTQFDTQRLFNPKNYLNYLDDEEINSLIRDYQVELKQYNSYKSELNKLKTRSDNDLQKLDFLKYQIKEIELANLSVEEEEELKRRSNYLENYESILNNLKMIVELYEDNNTLDNIYNSISALSKLENFDKKYSNYKQSIENSYYIITDAYEEITKELKATDFDQIELNQINDKLGVYSDFKRKYKKSTEEIIDYYIQIKQDIENIENYDEILNNLDKKVNEAFNKTLKLGKNIREKRIVLAKNLEKNILENLKDLKLKNTKFEIVFNNTENIIFYPNGIDEIDFNISFNIGEPLRPLSKVASGGELSRFMLALKVLVSENLDLQTIIFDEIDNGVSGEIAYSIANKIKTISRNIQVLCVTHLPQVAAISDQQVNIYKEVKGDRTTTHTEELCPEERVIEIAKMISNGEVTNASKTLASELLKK